MSERGEGTRGVVVADARGAAARGGLRSGDRIVSLNWRTPVDVLDLEDAAADGTLWVTALRAGHPLDLVVAPEPGEWHGISLDHGGLGDEPRVCRNRCRFCFVDQVPAGLRAALSVKDDDYRLSFLHGNFTTLTNLGEEDLQRIAELRLSPLFVSLHAWDDDARVRLMGRAASGSRATLEWLVDQGVTVHLQVVLCPGWNDGEVLAETVARAAELATAADLGVVPVSLAHEGDLRRVSAADARRVVRDVEHWQAVFAQRRGDAFVHAADEFYLLAGLEPPASGAPEQYENGVGVCGEFRDEAGALAAGWRDAASDVERPAAVVTAVRLLSGTLAEPVVGAAAVALSAVAGVRMRAFSVANDLFGSHVTVTGLLGGREVLAALQRQPLGEGEWLLAPRTWLPADLGRTLDDVGEDELTAACDGRLVVTESLGEAFARLAR